MAIRITEDGVVNYENSPDVSRKLFPNLNVCGKEIDKLEEEINGKAPAVFSMASGSIASFDNGADDMPLKSCVVNIEPIQEGEGDPSPENVRPITGRAGLTVYKRGANLVDDSIKNINTTATSLYVGGAVNAYVHYFKAGTYTLSCAFADGTHYGAYIKETDSAQITIWTTTSTFDAATFTVTKDGFYRLWFYNANGVSADNVSNIMLNVGDTALPYEPYKQTENVSVNWETEVGTVYGGTLDVVSGKLMVDRAAVDLGALTWAYDSTYERFTSQSITDPVVPTSNTVAADIICSMYKTVSINANRETDCSCGLSMSGILGIKDTSYGSDVVAFKTAMSGVQLVYKLAEPVEYQLSANEIRTLLGENNIWSDAGDVSVDYPADTKTYIDDLSIKTVEVTGQTPTITAEENTRYICGEVTSLNFTPSEKGICDVRFTAASISTVLVLPETVKLPDWFDRTLLEANTTYEINIVDGVYGVVMSWA